MNKISKKLMQEFEEYVKEKNISFTDWTDKHGFDLCFNVTRFMHTFKKFLKDKNKH